MRPCNYFLSKEFRRTVAIIGLQSIPYLSAIFHQGFTFENLAGLLFGGIIGAGALSNVDLEQNKNLYTPKGLPYRDPENAIANCAKTIAIQTAVSQVLGKQNDVAAIASDILQGQDPREIIANQLPKDQIIRAIGTLL
jgi:hypothetical protein